MEQFFGQSTDFATAHKTYFTAIAQNIELKSAEPPVNADSLNVVYRIIQENNRMYCEYMIGEHMYNWQQIRRLLKHSLKQKTA